MASHSSLCPLSWSGTTVWSNGNHWKFWKGIILAQEMLTPATAFGVVDFMMLRVSYMMDYDGMFIYLLTYHGSIHHTPLQTARPRITKLPYLRMPCFHSNEIHIMKGLPGLWRTRTPSHDLKTFWLGINRFVCYSTRFHPHFCSWHMNHYALCNNVIMSMIFPDSWCFRFFILFPYFYSRSYCGPESSGEHVCKNLGNFFWGQEVKQHPVAVPNNLLF